MKRALVVLMSLLSLIACSGDGNKIPPETEKSFSYFESRLKKEMDYETPVATFGEPAKDRGSGIHIYVYGLEDATQIWIGYADKILYAHHVDSAGQLIKTLI
ncbi:MAG: hypothetical protein U0X91_19995 [Spirosomataceae bacterium]